MSEPPIVVANREHLWWLLNEASQLEHMILCQYLFAEASLKSGTEEGLTEEQAEAVAGWRSVLSSIAVEEMLHLALVSNLLAAIGAAPTFGRPNFPQRSGYFPSGIQLDLLPFGEQALRHFLYLERPEGMQLQDAEEFEPVPPSRTRLDPEELMPRGQEYQTIGHLYRGLEEGLRALCERLGEHAVFVGSPHAQATPELFRWPQIVAVTDMKSAQAAIDLIIEQGEGARGDWRQAHYGRFLDIWQRYGELRAADPGFEPARPALAGYLRQPYNIAEPQPIITDPEARRTAELAAVAYELVLHALTRFFTHTDETGEQLGLLIGVSIGLMADVLRPMTAALTRLPIGSEHPGRTAGFSYEMYYAMSNFVPWREPSWALLHERMRVLEERCAAAAAAGGQESAVAARARQRVTGLADRVREHVPPALLPAPHRT
ncbi:ferritin-like protein [Actinomadura sp. ATCC 31491]|uniref:Ferritin-like protein n=1 Tax=Actinomadura luzonensis TaxID=2805427 RepID=A0ABT0G7S3_9ACTN|nr:ferritin-like protein [Actinomadura luzonensis]MCK2220647.1 ferritin-like protein [Actinomadura luzonensis]